MLYIENTEQRGTGIMGWNGQMEWSILIGLVQPTKVVHLERWADSFDTFTAGPNQSIQF